MWVLKVLLEHDGVSLESGLLGAERIKVGDELVGPGRELIALGLDSDNSGTEKLLLVGEGVAGPVRTGGAALAKVLVSTMSESYALGGSLKLAL